MTGILQIVSVDVGTTEDPSCTQEFLDGIFDEFRLEFTIVLVGRGGYDGWNRLRRLSEDHFAFLLRTLRERFFEPVGILVVLEPGIVMNELNNDLGESIERRNSPLLYSIRPCGDADVQQQ